MEAKQMVIDSISPKAQQCFKPKRNAPKSASVPTWRG